MNSLKYFDSPICWTVSVFSFTGVVNKVVPNVLNSQDSYVIYLVNIVK